MKKFLIGCLTTKTVLIVTLPPLLSSLCSHIHLYSYKAYEAEYYESDLVTKRIPTCTKGISLIIDSHQNIKCVS